MKKLFPILLTLLLVLLLAVGCTPKDQPEHDLDVDMPDLVNGEAGDGTPAETDADGNPVETSGRTGVVDPNTGIILDENELPIIPYEDEPAEPGGASETTTATTGSSGGSTATTTEPATSTTEAETEASEDWPTAGENELPIIPIG